MTKPSPVAVENAILKALVRSLTKALINALDHSANLNEWKAAYFLVKQSPWKYNKYWTGTIAERHVELSSHYTKLLDVIEEAIMYLEGKSLIFAITSLDRVANTGAFVNDEKETNDIL